jgi:hypothetical protein
MKRIHDARASGEPIPAAVYHVFAPEFLDPTPRLKQETEEAVLSNLLAGPSRQADPPAAPAVRPLWYLCEGGLPVREYDLRPKDQPVWFSREGDPDWSLFDPARPPQICDRMGWVVSHYSPRRSKPKGGA